MKLQLKKTYRVREVLETGRRSFHPQERYLYFFWKGFIRKGFEALEEEFTTLEAANKFLYTNHVTEINKVKSEEETRIKKKLDKKVDHPFDAVFYKLQKTKNK